MTLWVIIISLGIGTFLLRFSFLGLVGNRPLPPWLLRHLRYTAVAILPAMVAPLVAFSNEAGTGPDAGWVIATAVVVGVGMSTRNVIAAIVAGAATLGVWIMLIG